MRPNASKQSLPEKTRVLCPPGTQAFRELFLFFRTSLRLKSVNRGDAETRRGQGISNCKLKNANWKSSRGDKSICILQFAFCNRARPSLRRPAVELAPCRTSRFLRDET